MLKLLRKLLERVHPAQTAGTEATLPESPKPLPRAPRRDAPAPVEVSEGNTEADWDQWEQAVARQHKPAENDA